MSKGTAIITGATSGIGAEFARQLAGEGFDLIVTGRRMSVLEALATELEARNAVRCRALRCEITDEADLTSLEDAVRSCPDLALLVNNAGFGTREDFLETALAEHLATIAVHDSAAVRLAYAALPGMIARGGGSLVFTSSMAAFIPTPKSPLYSASKAFLNAFADSLHVEYANRGIRVQALCPGFTHTDFHGKIGWDKKDQDNRGFFRWMEPAQVARISLRALRRGRPLCVPGLFYKTMFLAIRILPRALVRRIMSGRGMND